MGTSRVVITLGTRTLHELDRLVKAGRSPSRSRVIQAALEEMTSRHKRRRLIEELAKLDATEEKKLAEEFYRGEPHWPEY